MKYSISWSEKKTTSTGKDKIDATLKGEDGVTVDRVTIWGDYPGFAGIMTGHDVEGDLVPAKDPKYGPTLYPPKIKSQTGNFSKAGGMKMMEEKAKNIEKAQERKSESIAFFNATNSAIALIKNMDVMSESELKLKIKVWRDWFYAEFENWNNQPF